MIPPEEDLPGSGQEPAGDDDPGVEELPERADGPEVPAESAGPGEPAEPEESGESEEPSPEDAPMSLMGHLGELRKRLLFSVIALAVGFVACYGFSERLFDILILPMAGVLHDSHFQYTSPPEAFFTYLKVSFVAGFFVVSPYIFYQVWSFVSPGLYRHERKWIVPIAVFSALFFVCGALFGYFIVFPFGFEFFASFSSDKIQFIPKLNEYTSFSLRLLFAFGLVFELPLFIFFLARLGVVSSKALRKQRKYAILCAFILAAILTPPDPFTQTLMAGPLVILYELGIWVAYFFGKEKDRREEAKAGEAEAAEAGDGDKAEDKAGP
ncbi:MAG: twin-arginine translocase subunit TatC [Desulfovibrionaceae bacterium]|nr:twin-arginine translocase subunit TatC [Desulfovibrionaceae bacterium]